MTQPQNPQRAFFDELRKLSYAMAGDFTDEETFTTAVLAQAERLNRSGAFDRTSAQVENTARQCASWTWDTFIKGAMDRQGGAPSPAPVAQELPRYRFISHVISRSGGIEQFEKQVNELLNQGYEPFGPPCMTLYGSDPIAGQALFRPA
ncbi:DUF1737 domain-containing protein [Nocardia cyriacigeorgica]|uniref:DUF1737 domain-containing protein n=1 Tax=Nocardia cyriacigeorgica TaxID=135487 RepID=UPI0024557FB1|nr:DUF1737 domain-containing protein [Nocardia cyriacigeorgica]